MDMAKGGGGFSELPLDLDPSLPKINIAELMLGTDSNLFIGSTEENKAAHSKAMT